MALPAALVVAVIYLFLGAEAQEITTVGTIRWWKVVPYLAVLICAGAEWSICGLVAFANICTANNTIAILSVGDMTRHIAERFEIDPRRSASLLDTTSCCVQGLLPYGAQLLMASGLAGISSLSIVPYLFYPVLLGVAVMVTICTQKKICMINTKG